MNMNIIAISLNPAIDVTLWIDTVEFEEPIFPYKEKLYAGGKAVNVSRVLTKLGNDNILLTLAGLGNLESFSELLVADGVDFEIIPVKGTTRENLTICLKDGRFIKINRDGIAAAENEFNKMLDSIQRKVDNNKQNCLVFSGEAPYNITTEVLTEYILKVKEKRPDDYIVLDNSTITLEQVKKIKPFLFKPNRLEFEDMFCTADMTDDVLMENIKILSDYVTHLIVSLGKDGMLYAHDGKIHRITVPSVEKGTSVGAGDTTVACFIDAISRTNDPLYAVKYAAAGGTASVMLDGTDTVTFENIQKIMKGMVI